MPPADAIHRPLSADDLLAAGPPRRLCGGVHAFAQIDSTNAFLLARAAELPDGTIVVAESQTAGRGRQGRQWLAPRGSSILLSVLLHEPADSPLLHYGAMLAALAACEAVTGASTCRPLVRWPNDLVLSGRKLGGVLAETTTLPRSGRPPVRRAVVLGVGLNCLQQRGHFVGELADKATSLELESQTAVDRRQIAAALVAALDARLVSTAQGGLGASLRREWTQRCADVGARVHLTQDGQSFSGTVLDVTEDGDLIVQLDLGARRCFAAATTTRSW